jgi:hypothetical protein
MNTDEMEYLWKHFAFNAEQRLKAFNFFVVFAVFSNGGMLTAFERNSHPLVFVFIGFIVVSLPIVFWIIDTRSRNLLKLAVPGLKECEKRFSEHSRLFCRDEVHSRTIYRYTVAFRLLFSIQFVFGLIALTFGIVRWACDGKAG